MSAARAIATVSGHVPADRPPAFTPHAARGAVGLPLLAAFVAWERRAPAPMLPPAFFARREFSVASLACVLAYFGLFGSLFEIGQLLQTGRGATPVEAGLELLPIARRWCWWRRWPAPPRRGWARGR